MAKPADRFRWTRWVGMCAVAWSMVACGPSEPRETESHLLRFRIVAPGLSADSSLCVAGSPSVWGPWLPNGTVGLEEQLQPGLDDMEALLEAVGQPHVVNVYEGAKHFESDWGARLPEALLWLESRHRLEGRN